MDTNADDNPVDTECSLSLSLFHTVKCSDKTIFDHPACTWDVREWTAGRVVQTFIGRQ